MEDATGTVAVAGGARAGLETPTPSDASGRDVFTITHKNTTSEISFLMTRFQVQESLEFHVRSVLVSSVLRNTLHCIGASAEDCA